MRPMEGLTMGNGIQDTADSLGDLAKLAWQAGFDFVLYEVPKKSGIHLHCSVKRSPDAPLPPRPEKDKGGKS